MRSVCFQRWFVLALFLGIALASTRDSIAATTPTRGVKLRPTSVFQLDDGRGRMVSCASIRRRFVSGVYRRGIFLQNTYQVSDIKAQMKRARGKKLAALKKKLASVSARVRTLDGICRLGPDPLTPIRRALTEADIRHLYDRTAFGAVTPTALQIGLAQGATALVTHLMTPTYVLDIEADAAKYLDENYAVDSTSVSVRGVQLWALNLLLRSPNPFHERLGFLFYHNMLATSMEVLTDSSQYPLMVRHLEKLRNAAYHGDYQWVLKEITRDPVMLIWLNGNQNTKQQPNENFGRELMELFTLSPTDANGNINYSETTVAEVARACTGWTVQNLNVGNGQREWSAVFGQAIHDTNPKVIFEGTAYQGVVQTDFDVIDHIFRSHPDVDNYLAERIAKEFLNETPSTRVVDSLAKTLRASNFNINVTLRKLLLSEEFFKDANRNSIVATPMDKMVKLIRTTGIPYDLNTIRSGMEGSGQIMGMPPSVFGWDNPEWPNGQWLLTSVNTVTQLVRNDSLFNQRGFLYSQLLPHAAATDAEALASLQSRLNVTLSAEQRTAVLQYMNTALQTNNSITADVWDPLNAGKVRRKMAGVIEILARTNDYQMR
jgi:uncharacterized protein (DUF1800 family)